MKPKFLSIILMVMLLFVFVTPALAQGPGDNNGRVIFGGNLTLKEEEKVEGGVVVFGGNFSMPASSTVKQDVAVFGGNANIDGTVEGQIVMLGGNLNLGETAVVKGDVGLLGGEVTMAKGAKVEGKVSRWGNRGEDGGFTAPVPPLPPMPPVPEAPKAPEIPSFGHSSWGDTLVKFVQDTAVNIAIVIALAAIAWLEATFMPQKMKTVSDTMTESPVMSVGGGLLTTLVCIVLAITICLLCIAIPGFVILGIAGLFGWIVAGQILGERLLTASGRSFPGFVQSAVIGVVVLTLVTKMPVIGWIPCIGWVLAFLGGLVGMIVTTLGTGAVILTRFGTRPYYKRSYSAPVGPAPAPAPRPTWTEAELAGLDVTPASEAELKAKIKAALDESDTDEEEKPKKRQPRKRVTDDETPAPTGAPEDEKPAE